MALTALAEGSKELTVTVTSAMHNPAMAPFREAENALVSVENAHKNSHAKLRLGDLIRANKSWTTRRN